MVCARQPQLCTRVHITTIVTTILDATLECRGRTRDLLISDNFTLLAPGGAASPMLFSFFSQNKVLQIAIENSESSVLLGPSWLSVLMYTEKVCVLVQSSQETEQF